MRYALVKCEDCTSSHFRGAEPLDRATWLCLMVWCYEQENGGRITGARAWGDRRWQQTIAVTKQEIERVAAGLWEWDGDDLIVPMYDVGYVEHVRLSSRHGSAGGRSASGVKAESSRLNGLKGGRKPNTEPNAEPNAEPNTEPNTEPNADPKRTQRTQASQAVSQAVSQSVSQREGETPSPSISSKSAKREPLVRLLRSHGLSCQDEAVSEWGALFQGLGGCKDASEALEAIGWALDTARREGLEVSYAKHARALAEKWHRRQARVISDLEQVSA